ncbi:MAG: hydrogenase [Candidatus Omnitrophica bacterium]|nr:hydrogenase [Candidatus Omnitrophota bacterium]
MEKIIQFPWHVPFGEFTLKLDPLSLIFLTAIIILTLCAGIYGVGYMRSYQGARSLKAHAFFFLLLAVAIGLVVTANNVILFLCAWELMSIATYFLIVFHDEKPSVRRAGFLYLIATHCGTFCLFLMFFLMARTAGSMDFTVMAHTTFSPALAGIIFFLAIIGSGVKAGFLPMHIWLPHAHPAAPSHVSAFLSGVTIKIGIYGICRVLWIMGIFPNWCGYVLLTIGIVSGVMGVLYALGQHEIKRLLAYHSIENIGIIALGLGVGLLGRSYHQPFIAALGFAGALLHVINHAIFKGLLFLGAGAVIQKMHTGEIDKLGGVAKIMPLTSTLFLVGALSICGLPLFNGFISEFMIYFGLFQGVLALPLQGVVFFVLGILSLALIGALALACFTKVYGIVFLGNPRSSIETKGTEEVSAWMMAPMFLLAGLCIWIGLMPAVMARLTFMGGNFLAHMEPSAFYLGKILNPLSIINGTAFVLLALIIMLVFVRRWLLGKEPMPTSETWSCGFTQLSSKLQYTSSSFARPIVQYFRNTLLFRRYGGEVSGEFPQKAQMSSHVHDASEDYLFRPVFTRLRNLSKRIDEKSIRYTQIYLIYIFVFLIFLLVWKMRG